MALIASELKEHAYPEIAKAALEMSYANGGVNRDRSEADVLSDLNVTLEIVRGFGLDFDAINAWLGGLGNEALLTVVDGEETDANALTSKAPVGTQALLNAIFHGAA